MCVCLFVCICLCLCVSVCVQAELEVLDVAFKKKMWERKEEAIEAERVRMEEARAAQIEHKKQVNLYTNSASILTILRPRRCAVLA